MTRSAVDGAHSCLATSQITRSGTRRSESKVTVVQSSGSRDTLRNERSTCHPPTAEACVKSNVACGPTHLHTCAHARRHSHHSAGMWHKQWATLGGSPAAAG